MRLTKRKMCGVIAELCKCKMNKQFVSIVHQSTKPIFIIVVEQTSLVGLSHLQRESPGSCLTARNMGNLKRNEGDSEQMHNLCTFIRSPE